MAENGDKNQINIEMKEIKPKETKPKEVVNGTGKNFMYIYKNLDRDNFYTHDNYLEKIKKQLDVNVDVVEIAIYVEELPERVSAGGESMCAHGLDRFAELSSSPLPEDREAAAEKCYHAIVVFKMASDAGFIAFDKGVHLYVHVSEDVNKTLLKYVGDRTGVEANIDNIKQILTSPVTAGNTLYEVLTWIDSMKWAIKGYSLIPSSCHEFAREIYEEFTATYELLRSKTSENSANSN